MLCKGMQSNACTLLLFFAVRTVGCDSGVFNGTALPWAQPNHSPPTSNNLWAYSRLWAVRAPRKGGKRL